MKQQLSERLRDRCCQWATVHAVQNFSDEQKRSLETGRPAIKYTAAEHVGDLAPARSRAVEFLGGFDPTVHP